MGPEFSNLFMMTPLPPPLPKILGGGFHHCSSGEGGGFCAYADITLCIKVMYGSVKINMQLHVLNVHVTCGTKSNM